MRFWLLVAALDGFLAVALGAFAAHGLSARLSGETAAWFETALKYQMFHAAALLAVALLAARGTSLPLTLAGAGFIAGSLLFCGLLYLMALGAPRALGAVVPLGGLAFLLGWAALAWHALGR